MVRLLVGIGAAVGGALVGLLAQSPRDVTLRIDAAPLTRDRDRQVALSGTVTVILEIPAGHFVPAETRSEFHGAWLKLLQPFDSRPLPTFPVPQAVRLPGSSDPVLAYSGTVRIRVPIDVLPGLETGPQPVTAVAGLQLCDASRCSPPRTLTSRANPVLLEAPVANGYIAFRNDDASVVIATGRRSRHDRTLSYRPVAARVLPVAILPSLHEAMAQFRGDAVVGSQWILKSGDRRAPATAERPAAFAAGCEDTMPLALIARVSDPAFATDRSRYFVAAPHRDDVTRPTNPRPIALDLRLTAPQLRALESLLNRQLRITLPTVFAPIDAYGEVRDGLLKEADADRRIRNGEGRMAYHYEAFKLAPDEDPRLYVRAYWTAGGVANTGLTLWLRFDGRTFSVEHSDASISPFAHFESLRDPSASYAQSHAARLLNVVAADDGWAELIMRHIGYESVSVSVWKYSAAGPVFTGIGWGHGC